MSCYVNMRFYATWKMNINTELYQIIYQTVQQIFHQDLVHLLKKRIQLCCHVNLCLLHQYLDQFIFTYNV